MALVSAAPISTYANPLTLPAPSAERVAPATRWMIGLFLLCLVPRAIEAWKIDTLCKDGVFYIQLAEGFERGDIEAGLGRLRLNTYPLILASLHRCGLDWETAAEWWGVFISSLAVLPLFGWVRRQFDVRVAAAACFLYAVHPKFIEWAPEAIRDPTFWFFWSCSLYAIWRAATEVKWVWFGVAGAAITLALHTRFEGWFLYLPLVWWSACRYRTLVEQRWKIAAGTALTFCVCPALLLLVNLTWLAQQPRWELGNFGRLEYVVLWYQAATKKLATSPQATIEPTETVSEPRLPAAPAVERADVVMPRMSTRRTALAYANALRRGIGGAFGIMWLLGFMACPRFWLRRDHLVLFAVSLCVASGIWIHLWYAQATSSRYFLTIVLLASGCAGVGWLKACDWLSWATSKVGGRLWTLRTALTVFLLLIASAGIGQAVTNRYTGRQRDAALGRWLHAQFGSHPRLVTSGTMELVDHYAAADVAILPADREAAARLIADFKPSCVVLSRHAIPADVVGPLLDGIQALGFEPVADARLPHGFRWTDLIVAERYPSRQVAGALDPIR